MNFKKMVMGSLTVLAVLSFTTPSALAATVPLPTIVKPVPRTADSIPWSAADQQTTPTDLGKYGYVEEEYFLSGTANVYNWENYGSAATIRTANAPYTNRILVRRPIDTKKFSGNVILEVANTTSGYERQPIWQLSHDQFLQNGDVYVSVASKPVSIILLKKFNPTRYTELSWANPLPVDQRGKEPGWGLTKTDSTSENEDGLFWDIYSQTAALMKSHQSNNPLKGYGVKNVYGAGYSQSSCYLMTYINAIHPMANLSNGKSLFDGFLLAAGGAPIQINQDASTPDPSVATRATVPVIRLQTQSDFNSMPPLQPLVSRRSDSNMVADKFRLYEVPGAAHGTNYLNLFSVGSDQLAAIGVKAPRLSNDPSTLDFPFHYIVNGAFVNLDLWVRKGTVPPYAGRISVDREGNAVTDEFGNAIGGVRTPYVDVPVATYIPHLYHMKQLPFMAQWALGYKIPFSNESLVQLYPMKDSYIKQFVASTNELLVNHWITVTDAELMKEKVQKESNF